MYQDFRWTRVAEQRNIILRKDEPLQPYVIVELAKAMQSEIFVDVGANIGAYSLFMSSLECIHNVYSFEAASETFGELRENVRLNDRAGKIHTFNQAVSDTEGSVRFGLVGSFSGANSVVSTSIHDAEKFTKETVVDCVSLDHAVTERSKGICVKIDVEGHEKAVLAGAKHLLMENAGVIQLENYALGDSSLSELLRGYGYTEIFSIGPDVYFTNRQQTLRPEVVLAALSRAAGIMIRADVDIRTANHGRPGRVRLCSGAVLEISGPLASFARNLKAKLTSSRQGHS